jgi:hypothetical protein
MSQEAYLKDSEKLCQSRKSRLRSNQHQHHCQTGSRSFTIAERNDYTTCMTRCTLKPCTVRYGEAQIPSNGFVADQFMYFVTSVT